MANILNAAAGVLGEVADYLRTEAEGLQQEQQHGKPNLEQKQREEHEHATRGAADEDATARVAGSSSSSAAATATAAADGSGDSLYGPEGLNATAPDISWRDGPEQRREMQRAEEREGGGGLGDLIRGAQGRIAEEAQQLKERFDEGYREAHDRPAAGDQQLQLQQQQQRQEGEKGPGGEGEGRGEGSLQETLRAAKARIDEETELLKLRFREGYQESQDNELKRSEGPSGTR